MSRPASAAAWLVLLVVAVTPPATSAQAPGVYTAAQAERGLKAYRTHCAACHGADLGGGTGPALRGSQFTSVWNWADVRSPDDLFYLLRTTMPRPNAGSLPEGTYLDLLAYVFQKNGLAAGSAPLVADRARLRAIKFPESATAAGPAAPREVPQFIAGEHGARPSGSGPAQQDLDRAETSTDWLSHTHDYAGTRYSPLDQITTANVSRLVPVCRYRFKDFGPFQSGPLVYRGTMFLTTMRSTVAIDAATCAERWHYAWHPRDKEDVTNSRGAAIKDGYVVRPTADGYLVALDAGTGSLLWARQAAKPSLGESFSMAPLIYDDLILIGPAGSESNIKGWIGAFRLADGAPVWRFNTVPHEGEPGTETWANPYGIPMGGGAIWTPLSLDPLAGEVFLPVTNPAPDFPAHMRPGKNLYTNAMVVLDVRTGKLKWYDQIVPNDSHDYDLTQVIFETEVTTRSNQDVPFTSKQRVRFCPGFLGGVEWNGPAWSPRTNLLYVPAVDWCAQVQLDDTVRYVPRADYMGGKFTLDSTRQGWLTAIDGRPEVWSSPEKPPETLSRSTPRAGSSCSVTRPAVRSAVAS